MQKPYIIIAFTLLLHFHPTLCRPFVLVLSQDDLSLSLPSDETDADFDDEFPDPDSKPDHVLDPGSWSPLFQPDPAFNYNNNNYYSGVGKLVDAVSKGDVGLMEEGVGEIEGVSGQGDGNGQSVMGFLFGFGIGKERNEGKAFLYREFAAKGGNSQSKMALAYTYYRQEVVWFFC